MDRRRVFRDHLARLWAHPCGQARYRGEVEFLVIPALAAGCALSCWSGCAAERQHGFHRSLAATLIFLYPSGVYSPTMRENTLKQRLNDGKPAFGVMCTFLAPAVVEMLGHLGFDWIPSKPLR